MAGADFLKPKRLKKQLQAVAGAKRAKNAGEVAVVSAAHAPTRRNDIQPLMATVMRPIDQLKPAPHRARVSTPELRVALLNSVREFGFLMPLLIDRQDQIIAGYELWQAAKELGLEKIECRVAEHLSPVECEAASLALNKVGELGGYDLEVLRERMIVIKSSGIKLISTGFSLPEIDQILTAPKPPEDGAELDDEDEDDEDVANVNQLGDLFELGDHRLLCGDALELSSYEHVLAGRAAACVFSDAPYGCDIEGFVSGLGKHKHPDFIMGCDMDQPALANFFATYLAHCKASTSPGAVIFACMDWRQIDTLLVAGREVGLTRNNVACWHKGGGMGGLYRNAHEFVAVFINGKSPATNNVALGVHGRDRTNVWFYAGANRKGSSAAQALADHPTPKPVELVQDALLDVTNPGDVVLDPFSGSGTTIIAAEACGRIGCGIELDPKYVDRSIRRWEALTGKHAIHLESGLTFSELTAERGSKNQDPSEAD